MSTSFTSHPTIAYGYVLLSVAGIFHFVLGWPLLDVTNDAWLYWHGSDRTTHYLGWLFFRFEDWGFPLGLIKNYGHPLYNSISLTDSIPMMAILSKLINPILPETFQYIGLWQLINFTMQGIFAIKIFRTLGVRNPHLAGLGAVFLVFMPVLLWRLEHAALCAQWMILASIYLYIKPITKANLRGLFAQSWGLQILACLTHPYLAIMVLAINFTVALKRGLVAQWPWRASLILLSGQFLVMLVIWWILGYFNNSIPEIAAAVGLERGYTTHSTNLNAMLNPYGFSKLLPKLSMVNQQQEGFTYLGISLIFLTIFSIVWIIRRVLSAKATYLPLLLISLAMYGFALTNVWYMGDHQLLSFSIPKFLQFIPATFRGAGRFAWPLMYLLVLGSITYLAKYPIRTIWKVLVLTVLLGVQLWDISPLFNRNKFEEIVSWPLNQELWSEVIRRAEGVQLFPAFTTSVEHSGDYMYFATFAAKHNKPINTFYIARFDGLAVQREQERLVEMLQRADMEALGQQIVIAEPNDLDLLMPAVQTGKARLYNVDNYLLLVPHRAQAVQAYLQSKVTYQSEVPETESLPAFLERQQAHTVLIASNKVNLLRHPVCDSLTQLMTSFGSRLDTLANDTLAYIGILREGKIIFEDIQANAFLFRDFSADSKIGEWTIDKTLYLESSTLPEEPRCKIIIDGRWYRIGQDGWNLVVVDDQMRVIETGRFIDLESCTQLALPQVF